MDKLMAIKSDAAAAAADVNEQWPSYCPENDPFSPAFASGIEKAVFLATAADDDWGPPTSDEGKENNEPEDPNAWWMGDPYAKADFTKSHHSRHASCASNSFNAGFFLDPDAPSDDDDQYDEYWGQREKNPRMSRRECFEHENLTAPGAMSYGRHWQWHWNIPADYTGAGWGQCEVNSSTDRRNQSPTSSGSGSYTDLRSPSFWDREFQLYKNARKQRLAEGSPSWKSSSAPADTKWGELPIETERYVCLSIRTCLALTSTGSFESPTSNTMPDPNGRWVKGRRQVHHSANGKGDGEYAQV